MNAQKPGNSGDVPVVCDVCGTRMYVSSAWIGREVECPDCQKRNRVKPPPPPVPPTKPRYTGDEYRLADDAPSPTAAPSELVKIICATCYTLMHAKAEHAGKRVKCPDCGTINRVPRPPEKKKVFQVPDASDIVVESGPPPMVDERRKEIAERLMADAKQHVEQREREKPPPLKAPLSEGIYSFPFHWNVAPLWIGMAVALLLDLALLKLLIDVIRAGGYASIAAAFFAPMVAILTFSILGLAAPHFLTIIEFTADGHDQIPYWPSQDLLSRMHAMLFAVNALAMSTMPGMLVVGLLRPLGVPLVLGAISTVLLFPLIALSMAGNDSVFAPYSSTVFRSLKRHRRSWLQFYAQIILMAMLLVGIDFAVWAGMGAVNARAAAPSAVREMISPVFTIISVCWYAVLYCRLLGRMAYILAQDEADEEDVEGNDNEETDAGRREPTDGAADGPADARVTSAVATGSGCSPFEGPAKMGEPAKTRPRR